ncbi:hypothetical protein BGX26_002712 [Mortierella sp. AD094]|nr:hypothetical protein BGX26_002712 [Mortierella sp. AD094]
MGLPADIKYTQNKANNRRVDEGNKDTMTGERDILISKIGLDHYLLIRFLRMLSSLSVMSVVLAIAVLVPLYNIGQSGEDMDIPGASFLSQTPRIEAMHIGNATDNERLLATVMVTAVISVVLLQRIPKGLRSVSALKQVLSTAPGGGVEHVYLIRDAATLEKAVKRRQVVLDKLEEAESRYMAAIARASALVSATSFSMRSRSWLGKGLDHLKACFGCGGIDAGLVGNQGEDDYVGPLKMYQIEGVPKISLTDLSAPEDASSSTLPGTEVDGGVGIRTQHHKNSGGSNTSKLAALNWFQKPKRPSHYNGIPFLSKRQDSIRYYRGELCRLNKVILQAYEEQALAMAAEKEYKEPGQRQANARRQGFTNTRGVIAQEKGKTSSALQSDTNNDSTPSGATENGKGDLIASKSSEAKVLSSAFVLMRTRAGAKAVASGAIASDKIPSSARNLGIPPRDIEWRVLGQSQSRWSGFICRIMIPSYANAGVGSDGEIKY